MSSAMLQLPLNEGRVGSWGGIIVIFFGGKMNYSGIATKMYQGFKERPLLFRMCLW